MVFVALVVSAVYAYTPLSKAGVSVSEPIASPDKSAVKGLRLQYGTRILSAACDPPRR